jgi:hypothetical protein|eukprot:COSAG06_NODE_7018_length_2672_cov_39.689468_2_plen_62_part_00
MQFAVVYPLDKRLICVGEKERADDADVSSFACCLDSAADSRGANSPSPTVYRSESLPKEAL